MKAQEVELALEEVEKAGEEQAKFGKCLGKKLLWFHYLLDSIKSILFYNILPLAITLTFFHMGREKTFPVPSLPEEVPIGHP